MSAEKIVGVWEVNAPDAPFPWHMMSFTPFGTMQQSNPHAGNPTESDSSGHGVWRVDGQHIIGKFVEVKANHKTGEYIGKGEIVFWLRCDGDVFSGVSQAYRYDINNACIAGPFLSPIHGRRVVLHDEEIAKIKE